MTDEERRQTDVALKYRTERPDDWPGDDLTVEVAPMIAADRADCCSAGPAMRVVLPANSRNRNPADLLLCGHHCRESRTTLARAGAAVYNAEGRLLSSGETLARDGRHLWLP